ncbi:MAG: NAD-dependent epimerase/dehydratase family protein [Candidatus Zixiibacteriota bacterium]
MPSDKQSILITGANGFVGSRLCGKFVEEGFHVIAGVRKTSDLSLVEGLELDYRYGDVTQPETLGDMVANVDYIIHNAGLVKAKRKQHFFEVNEKGTKSLFEAIAKHNPQVKKVIYISTVAAAGPSLERKPVTEDDDPHPITAYGRSKLAGERVALSFADRLNVLVIRPPAIYGPGDKEIRSFFDIVNKRIKPYFGSLDRRIQLVHIDDLSRGVFLAVTTETKSGEVYFIAENKSYKIKELVALLEKGCGKKGLPIWLPSPLFKAIAAMSELGFKLVGATPMLTREKAKELLASWVVSTAKAKTDLGFESQISFERGAGETYQWYREKGWLK